MSLETLVNGYKAVDQAVLKQYTRLGQHIPDEKLYKVTAGLGYTGNATAIVLNGLLLTGEVTKVHIPPLLDLTGLITYSVAIAGDFYANILGLNGELPSQKQTDSTQVIDVFAEGMLKYNRVFRLPLFAVGATFFGLLGYDVVKDVILDHPIEVADYIRDGLGTIGFLGPASSMYLKDQDPKLLEKEKEEENIKSLTPVYEQQ